MRKYIDNVLIYGGGILGFVAFFKNDFPTFWEQLSNMSGRTVLLTISVVAVVIGLVLKWREKKTTPRNVATKLRDWLENWQYMVRRITPNETHFGWEVVLPSGAIVWILRTNAREQYLTLLASVDPSAQQIEAFNGLGNEARTDFWRALILETSRAHISFRAQA